MKNFLMIAVVHLVVVLIHMTPLAASAQGTASNTAFSHIWDLNDVSVIYPLPLSPAEDQTMVHPNEGMADSPLLPAEVAGLFSDMEPPIKMLYPTLRLLTVRIDPCAIRDQSNCAPEIRLVWQSLATPPSGSSQPITTRNMAFHTFHRLTSQEFWAFANRLRVIIREYSPPTLGRPLDVHPAFIRDGIAGPFGKRFKALLLSTVSVKNIRRIAATGFTPQNLFAFASKDLINGKWVASTIPGTNATMETVTSSGQVKFGFDLLLNPLPNNLLSETLQMLRNSDQFFKKASSGQVVAVARELGSFQNPRLTRDRDRVNCIACHVAPNAERVVRLAFPQLDLFNANYRYRTPRHDLTDKSTFGWGSFAMSYQSGILSIHTRPIAESADSADLMNRLFQSAPH